MLGWVWVHCPNPHTVPRSYEMPTGDMQVCMWVCANVAWRMYSPYLAVALPVCRSAEGMTYLQQILAALRFMMAFLRSKDFHQLSIACWFFHCFLNHFSEVSPLSFSVACFFNLYGRKCRVSIVFASPFFGSVRWIHADTCSWSSCIFVISWFYCMNTAIYFSILLRMETCVLPKFRLWLQTAF